MLKLSMNQKERLMFDNFFSIDGRLSKAVYQKLAALLIGTSFLFSIVFGIFFPSSLFPTLLSVLAIVFLIPSSIRRLHDLEKSGWWIIGLFVPLVGIFVFLYMLFGNSAEQSGDI